MGTSETPSDFIEPADHYNDVNIESYENIGYVEDYENFIGTDIEGKNIIVYPNGQHERYEEELDEEGIMTSFGDLPAYEHDPYVKKIKKNKKQSRNGDGFIPCGFFSALKHFKK